MRIKFFKRVPPKAAAADAPVIESAGVAVPEAAHLLLSPTHPVIDIQCDELEGRRHHEVLSVHIHREDGSIAHLHFAVGITDRGQAFGEVAGMHNEPRKQVVRKASAAWRRPVDKGSAEHE